MTAAISSGAWFGFTTAGVLLGGVLVMVLVGRRLAANGWPR